MNLLFSNIVLIFVSARKKVRAESPKSSGLFLCPSKYCGGFHSFPVTGGPDQEPCKRVEPSLLFWLNAKYLVSMKNDSICVSTPQQIIEDLVTTDEASRMRDHLREMLDAYLLSEDDSRCRHEVYGTYLAIDRLIRRVELMEERRVA